jgi:hypothetical protein
MKDKMCMDYDSMGNYGRFPNTKKTPSKSWYKKTFSKLRKYLKVKQ